MEGLWGGGPVGDTFWLLCQGFSRMCSLTTSAFLSSPFSELLESKQHACRFFPGCQALRPVGESCPRTLSNWVGHLGQGWDKTVMGVTDPSAESEAPARSVPEGRLQKPAHRAIRDTVFLLLRVGLHPWASQHPLTFPWLVAQCVPGAWVDPLPQPALLVDCKSPCSEHLLQGQVPE